jgi:hypothetical protein
MSNTKTRATWTALLFALGCSSADGGGDVEGAGGDSAGGAGMGGGSRAAAGSGGGGAATSCEAEDPFSGPELRDCDLPGACGRCLWEKSCPSFLFQCAHNADCVCAAECIGNRGVGDIEGCLDQCGLSESPPGFAEFAKGASDTCNDEGCGRIGEPIAEPPGSNASLGAGTDADCVFDTNLSYDPCGPVLQLESVDGNICARIDRRDDGPGDDANTSWTLLDVRIGPLGEVCHTDAPADLCWFSSHHNFADWVHVSCGNRHYDINVADNCGTENRNPTSRFRLHVFENEPAGAECAPSADGACPIGTPVDLFPVP